MAPQPKAGSERIRFSSRLADLADRFATRVRAKSAQVDAHGKLGPMLRGIEDFFTQGVTREGLRDLVERDPRETFRFFTREIDFAALRVQPWYRRYPLTVWKVFLALAYRLSPPRRIAFAAAAFAFVAGLFRIPVSARVGFFESGAVWWLVSLTIFFLLLLMELRDKVTLKGDLEVAREIQFGLVPSRPYLKRDVSVHCFMRPANTVGGDYYDIIELGEEEIALVIADVAGKGMPAALLMALLQGSLRTLLTAGIRGREVVEKLNRYLCEHIPQNRLVTMFYGELHPASGRLRYVNAGHNAPFLIRPDLETTRLASTSVPLGFVVSEFEESEARLEIGSRLLIFTDGLSESFNPAEEEYGEARLGSFLRNHFALPQETLIQSLVEDVLAFCGDSRPHDDITLMSVERKHTGSS